MLKIMFSLTYVKYLAQRMFLQVFAIIIVVTIIIEPEFGPI